MVVHHHGLGERVKLVFSMPTERKPELMAHNPLGKIPVLVLEDGRNIIDSPVICQYLDGIGHGALLVPTGLEERIDVLHLEALADGIMESGVLMMLEAWRPEESQWLGQFEKQTDNIIRTLAALEQQADFAGQPLSLAHLALGSALDYIHHRLPAINIMRDWLAPHPKLAAWYGEFQQDAAMVETQPESGWS